MTVATGPDKSVDFIKIWKDAKGRQPAFQRAVSLNEIDLKLVVPIVKVADNNPIPADDPEIDQGAFYLVFGMQVDPDLHRFPKLNFPCRSSVFSEQLKA